MGSGLLAVAIVVALIVNGGAAGAATGVGFGRPDGTLVAPGSVAPPATASSAGLRAAAYSNQGVLNYGDAAFYGSPTTTSLSAPIGVMATTPSGKGYWLVAADGGVYNYGDAGYYGSAGAINLYAPIVGMAPTPSGKGYWLAALDGGIFSFGDAAFYGSTGAVKLNSPIVGMTGTADGKGYWLVAADGGIFTFGDAAFYGSTGAVKLDSAMVGMAPTTDGKGYWLVAADGGIFTFGDAAFYGSEGGADISASIAGMAVTPDGNGYWLAGSGGAVYWFGDAKPYGGNGGTKPRPPIAAIASTPSGQGYWLLEPDAFPTAFNHPGTGSAIAGIAATQVQADPDASRGQFCNPYGPCEPWCALFATWVWEAAGIPIPHYAFVGDVYTWAKAHSAALAPNQPLQVGDAVLYGTGPRSVATAVHMGIIAQVWPDGAIATIEGDSGPGPSGYFSVNINGPFLPTHSREFNGVGIFAVAVP